MSDKSKISVVDNTLVIDSDVSINGIFSNRGGNKNFGGITGEIRISILPTAPPGWLLCDGTSYLRNDYIDLSNVLGTLYGGDATNFNVPDLRYRYVFGSDGNNVDVSGNTTHNSLDGRNTNLGNVGTTGGNDNYNVTIDNFIKHHHDVPDHTHDILAHNHTITHEHNIITHNHNTVALSNHQHLIEHDHNVNQHTHSQMDHQHAEFLNNNTGIQQALNSNSGHANKLNKLVQDDQGQKAGRREGNERGPVTEGDPVNRIEVREVINNVQINVESVTNNVIESHNFTTEATNGNFNVSDGINLQTPTYNKDSFNYANTSINIYQTVFDASNDITVSTVETTTLESNPNVLSTNINNINNLIDTSGNDTIKNHYIPYMILNYIIKY